MQHPVIKKLRIQEGMQIAIIHAPEGYIKSLGKLPKDVKLETSLNGTHDLVHLFVRTKAELNKMAPSAAKLLKPLASFWISYPKKSAKIATDLSRDEGWKVMEDLNFEGVSLIAIDETWSAGRFKIIDDKVRTKRAGTDGRSEEDQKYIDSENRIVKTPADLQKALAKNKSALNYFESLSFTHKKEYVRWIIEAKKDETRKARVDGTIEKLLKKKKNPAEK
ncbi:MAG: YdeI/OmpD-associated family protein [Cytophagaceae bacterium]